MKIKIILKESFQISDLFSLYKKVDSLYKEIVEIHSALRNLTYTDNPRKIVFYSLKKLYQYKDAFEELENTSENKEIKDQITKKMEAIELMLSQVNVRQ